MSHDNALSVAVIIPAYTMRRWALTVDAVESARNQTTPPQIVVLSIDNNEELFALAQRHWASSATSGTPVRVVANGFSDHLAGTAMHVKAHGSNRRFGAGSARNTAAAQVSADILAFLDDDARAEPDWIEQLLAAYRETGASAVGGPPMPVYATGRPRWFPSNFDWVFGCSYEGMPTTIAPIGHLIGANMSVRRRDFEVVGGFHSVDFDDLDLCMRLADRFGSQAVYFAPRAIVHHFVPADRVTWHYFYRRCFFVNREKVRAFVDMGPAANLRSELAFVSRALTVHVGGELRRACAGDTTAWRRIGAMLVGMTLAGLGHLRGRVDLIGERATS
jgi:glucosyl-dolichyl phosphate glucuronosyltransferase